MNTCIGSCSLCGGRVMGFTGPWFAVVPPPQPTCESCGATMATGPVIPMVPARRVGPAVAGTAADEPLAWPSVRVVCKGQTDGYTVHNRRNWPPVMNGCGQ